MATKCKTVTTTATNTIGSPTLTAKQLKNKLKPLPLVTGENKVVNPNEPRKDPTSPPKSRNSPVVGLTNSRNISPSLHKRVDRSPNADKSLTSGTNSTMSPDKKQIQEGKSSAQSVKSVSPKPLKLSSMSFQNQGFHNQKDQHHHCLQNRRLHHHSNQLLHNLWDQLRRHCRLWSLRLQSCWNQDLHSV